MPALASARTRTLLHRARARIAETSGLRIAGLLAAGLLAACGGSDGPPDAAPPDAARPDAGSGCSGVRASRGEAVRVRPGLDLASGALFAPAVAVNAQAVAVVAWAERVGAADRVLATRFADGCWDAPVELAAAQAVGADAVIDADGRATVVWTRRELDASQGIAATTIWAARHQGGAWHAPGRISAEPALDYTSYALEPQVTLDDAGGVVVVWIQREAKGDSVAWNRFDPDAGPDTGWGAPGTIASGVILGAEAQVASAGPGQLVAIWRQRAEPPPREAVTNVFASRWTGAAWSAAEPIGDPSLAGSDHAEALALVSRGSDGATALWLQQQGGARAYRQNDLDAASQTWAGAVPVTPLDGAAMADGTVSGIDAAGSETGALTLVWLSADASRGPSDLWATRFDARTGWGENVLLQSGGSAHPGNPVVGMDARGRALSAWLDVNPGGAPDLALARGDAAGGWSAATDVALSIAGEPSLAVGRAGHALIALVTDAMVGGARHGSITAILYAPAP
jgi:hypothetical protein